MKRPHIFCLIILLMGIFCSCSGEDRSGEMPQRPWGVSVILSSYGVDGVIAQGHVEASPNSPLTACGFRWGNDTLSVTGKSEVAMTFSDTIYPPASGTYYIVAYAANYIGETCSDTLFFQLDND